MIFGRILKRVICIHRLWPITLKSPDGVCRCENVLRLSNSGVRKIQPPNIYREEKSLGCGIIFSSASAAPFETFPFTAGQVLQVEKYEFYMRNTAVVVGWKSSHETKLSQWARDASP